LGCRDADAGVSFLDADAQLWHCLTLRKILRHIVTDHYEHIFIILKIEYSYCCFYIQVMKCYVDVQVCESVGWPGLPLLRPSVPGRERGVRPLPPGAEGEVGTCPGRAARCCSPGRQGRRSGEQARSGGPGRIRYSCLCQQHL
jgi:hypothetical protein